MIVLYTVAVPLSEGAPPTIIELAASGHLRFADGTPHRAVRAYQALAGGEPDGRAALLDAWQRRRRPTIARLLAHFQLRCRFVHVSFNQRSEALALVASTPAPIPSLAITLPREWWRTVYLTGHALAGEAFCLARDEQNCELLVRRERDGVVDFPLFWADSQSLEVWAQERD